LNDFGLLQRHRKQDDRFGRWLLAGAVLAGFGLGAATEVRRPVVAALLGFLAGGTILNVLKEELPEERASRFRAFVLGGPAYTAVLLFV
jgi:hypothetical protein